MKIKSCKWLACVCLLLIGAMLFVGCDTNDDPTIERIETKENNPSDTSGETTSDTSGQTPEKVQLDAFGDLKISVEGISPRCTVVFDNSACAEAIRSEVTYTTDKYFYANGDTVTITATLSEQGEKSFALKDKTLSYAVSNMPAYYNTDMVADMSLIESELRDFVNAEIGQMSSTNKLFGVGGLNSTWYFSDVDYVKSSKAYLLMIKDAKQDQYGSANAPFYNSIRIVADCYAFTAGNYNGAGHIYICFAFNNVIVKPDGSVSWADNTLNITYNSKVDDNSVANEGVYRWAIYYSTQEMEKTDWVSVQYN